MSNNQDPPSKSRIDRFLLSTEWEVHFSSLSQKALPRFASDQFPIILDNGGFYHGRSYFKFKNMWLRHGDFVEKVRIWWEGYDVHGSPSFVLANKLKALKEDLERWNKEVFGM